MSIKKECKKCVGELRNDVLPPCSNHECINSNNADKKQTRNRMKKETKKAVKKPVKKVTKKATKAKK